MNVQNGRCIYCGKINQSTSGHCPCQDQKGFVGNITLPMPTADKCKHCDFDGGSICPSCGKDFSNPPIPGFVPISKDPQTQVHQLIQFAKDNGYGLAAEWMEKRK